MSAETASGMEPQPSAKREGSPLDAAVTNALVGVLPKVKLPCSKSARMRILNKTPSLKKLPTEVFLSSDRQFGNSAIQSTVNSQQSTVNSQQSIIHIT
ncbi:MAG: hypothetical protein LBB89_03250 [Treponema sp.]|jgi:antitoxin component of RelBE/YafQ-DinJ toxin-antitoxin module|nr:hypothetical protein [Treponema sp.]